MEAIITQLESLGSLVLAVARRDPGVSPAVAILSVSAVAVLAISLLALVLFALAPRKKRLVRRRTLVRTSQPAAAAAGEEQAPPSDRSGEAQASEGEAGADVDRPTVRGRIQVTLLGIPAMIVLAALFVVTSYWATGTDEYCTFYCHQSHILPQLEAQAKARAATGTATPAVDVRHGRHAPCTGCHRSNPVGDAVERTRMLWVRFGGQSDSQTSAVVDSRACMACHGDVTDTTVKSADGTIRMSHREPNDAGIPCVACHGRSGHAEETRPRMAQCVVCHDNQRASAKCATCHLARPSDPKAKGVGSADGTSTSRPEGSFVVPLDSGRCYDGCHDPKRCDTCHGTRMPHSAAFKDGEHARDAAWEGKLVCYRCHEPKACNDCHAPFATASNHAPGWKAAHATANPAGCACHDRRRPQRKEPFCAVCH
jgi:hypothetical protein